MSNPSRPIQTPKYLVLGYFLKLLNISFFQEALTLLARVYLLTNDWGLATEAADMVLNKDKKSTKARLVKAEALFNVCQFEHAMVHFHRGMVNQFPLFSHTIGEMASIYHLFIGSRTSGLNQIIF